MNVHLGTIPPQVFNGISPRAADEDEWKTRKARGQISAQCCRLYLDYPSRPVWAKSSADTNESHVFVQVQEECPRDPIGLEVFIV